MTLPPRARQSSVSEEAASTAVSLAAIDWDVALVDKDVRRLLEVLQDDGAEGKTYAGRSNSTPEGKAFLQNQVDGLMREKAQYKEKRMALMQRQQELQGGGGGGGRGSSASVANSSTEIPKATPPSLPQTPINDNNSTHSNSRRGSFPLGPRPSPGVRGHTRDQIASAHVELDCMFSRPNTYPLSTQVPNTYANIGFLRGSGRVYRVRH